MDLYVLDELLRRTAVIDQYESLIWTERYSAYGDFVLVIRSERGIRALLPVGTHLAILDSYRMMVVETVENTTSEDGTATLTVSGRSAEVVLESRVNRNGTIYAGNGVVPWVLTGTPGNIVRTAFNTICRNNTLLTGDNIPFLAAGSIFPAGTIAEPTDVLTIGFDLATMYEMIKEVCDQYNLGFRLVRNGDTSNLYFDVYTGNDRTTLQTQNSVVIFSPELDNLTNTKELTSTANYKNVAYVFGKNASMEVRILGDNTPLTGFNRSVLMVDATDIDLPAGAELTAALIQRGREQLAKHRPVIAFDGEISQRGSHIYGLHYNLGDLVEMRNVDGLATNMRVTEQIFISDKEGMRSYPTLSIDLLITPGSWYAWDAGEVWDDADGYWADA